MRIICSLTLFLLGMSLAKSADSKVDTAKVNEAVKKGVNYLRGFHASGVNQGQHGAGSIALSGLALMAGGTKDSDPTIAAIANALRGEVFTNNKTYDVSLMILFFDKLGRADDEGLIQLLGVKLLSGQNGQGGWGYNTFSDSLDGNKWMQAFRAWKPDGRMHPEVAKLYQASRNAGRLKGPEGGDDNSNTQFAVIATWVAGRHAVPIRDAANQIDARFIRTQNPQTGGWGYSGFDNSTPPMTCAGLLGLAVGFGSKVSAAELENKPKKKEKEDDDDPFSKPPPKNGGGEDGEEGAKPAEDFMANRRKAAIQRGLMALGRVLAGNRGAMAEGGHGAMGSAADLYFYWSVERVGVAYGMEQIGGVDWYEWGAPTLLQSQAEDGSWNSSWGGADVGTSFALLFLTRANLAVDLSAKLKNKFTTDLRGGGLPVLKNIPFAEQEMPKAEPGKPPPKISGIRELTQADTLADALAAANGKQFEDKLKEYQAAKGEQYSVAIAFALNRLEKDYKRKGREALVSRLTRMTPETLKKFTRVSDPELRRAACLACASKDDKVHIPDLIDRIVDPDEDVVRAARAGLRSLTGIDNGPYPDASDEEKQSVLSRWKFWLTSK